MPNTHVTAAELKSINEKLDVHILAVRETKAEQNALITENKTEQKQLNASLVASMEQLTAAVSQIHSFQVEMNHMDNRINDNKAEILTLREKQGKTTNELSKFGLFVEEYRVIKKVALSAVVVAILGGGYLTNSSSNKQEEMNNLLKHNMNLQIEALNKIANKK